MPGEQWVLLTGGADHRDVCPCRRRSDIDPTPVMAVFYYLFLACCSRRRLWLPDGACISLSLKKFPLEGNMRKTMKMFLYSGVSTIFWGALFGTWFGDIVPVICKNFLRPHRGCDLV